MSSIAQTPGRWVRHTRGASGCSAGPGSDHMDTHTLLVIVLVALLLGAGVHYSRGRV